MIRILENKDIDRIMEIWLETSIIAHDFISKNYWIDNCEVVKNEYIPICETYVYEDEGIVKGFIAILKKGFIGAIFIDNKDRGKGIGTKLMNHAKGKYDYLALEVYKDNNSSVKFYKKQNFKIIEENFSEETNKIEYVMEYKK
ncbi:N-acetyltransferase [uncultured Clostridium sp.]|jgi:putative acetyltransferase|uniref:N-acetyltransferase n=1 Tax=uncultured Clostridium sp. TaxID=59620 RepID=UPI002605BB00|nr:N-acetyltransferase [uncultured Clostridium sp.]